MSQPEATMEPKNQGMGLVNGFGGITDTNGGWGRGCVFKPEHQAVACLATNQNSYFIPPKALLT